MKRDASKIQSRPSSLASLNRKRDAWDGRKTGVLVDDLLAWAYRDELPRLRVEESSGSMASSALEQIAKYGVRISSTAPTFDPIEVLGPVDPDALRIAEAVRDLTSRVGDCEGVDFLGEPAFAMLTEAERLSAHEIGIARVLDEDGRLHSSLEAFVITGAVLRRARPVRIVDAVMRTHVGLDRGGNRKWYRLVERSEGPGRPLCMVEVDGYNRKANRPYPDAYRKSRLDPDPVPIVAERVEYQAWRAALDDLCRNLDLERFEALPNTSPWWPWEVAESAASDPGREKIHAA